MRSPNKLASALLLAALGVGSSRVAAETNAPPVQLAVSLTDGSRLIGMTTLPGLPLQSETLGKFEIPLERIRMVMFDRHRESVNVTLANGDHVQAGLGEMEFRVQTLLGEIIVPVDQVKMIRVRSVTASAEEFEPSSPYGLLFDGRQNYVAVPTAAGLDPTEAMTLECWIKTASQSDRAILGKRQWQSRPDHGYQLHIGSGRLLGHWDGRGINGKSVCDGQWHHVALTWDGEHRRLFQDGVKTAEDRPGSWTPCECEFRIGGIDGVGNGDSRDFFDGCISEVRLSKCDRYQGKDFTPSHGFEVDESTVGYWKLNDSSGSTVHDQSNGGHDGKLVGKPEPQWIDRVSE